MSQPDLKTWELLEKNHLVEGTYEANDEIPSPWYVKVLAAFSGWLASIFILGFVGVGFESIIKSSYAMLVVGSLMIIGAAFLLRHPKSEFLEHVSLAISLAGQILIVIAIFELIKGRSFTWFLIAAFQVPLAFFMPNYLHRFFSTFAAIFSLAISVSFSGFTHILNGLLMMFCAWLWLNEFNYSQQIKKFQAIGYGSVIALIALKSSLLFKDISLGLGSTKFQSEYWSQSWIGEILGAIAVVSLDEQKIAMFNGDMGNLKIDLP